MSAHLSHSFMCDVLMSFWGCGNHKAALFQRRGNPLHTRGAVRGNTCLPLSHDRSDKESVFHLWLVFMYQCNGVAIMAPEISSGHNSTAKIIECCSDHFSLCSVTWSAGRLFQAILSADADHLVLFSFPIENLPSHTQVRQHRPASLQLLGIWTGKSAPLMTLYHCCV